MATLTGLQSRTLNRGFMGQIRRDTDSRATGTTKITIEIEVRGNNPGYAQSMVETLLGDVRLRDFLGYQIINNTVPRSRYDELLERAQDLEENFNLRLNERIEEITDTTPDEDRYLTASEAAEIAGVTVATAVRYLDEGFWTGTRKKRGKNNCLRWLVEPNQSFRTKRQIKASK